MEQEQTRGANSPELELEWELYLAHTVALLCVDPSSVAELKLWLRCVPLLVLHAPKVEKC